ncbi:nicotinamide-nucleotide amidase [Lachnospiraceae bacterium]|nr:nicotinamide-nucleotide amidase [Lachnospiraceae bacterium]
MADEKKQEEKNAEALMKLVGIDHEKIYDSIKDLIADGNPTVEISEKNGEARLKLLAEATEEKSAKKILKPVVKEIKARLGEMIYTTDENENLENSVVRLLRENHFTITTAESCTGGLFTGRLVNVPGTSDILKEGFITYSDRAKRKYLGVHRRTLEKFTAVSEETAKEMAKGACAAAKADCSVAITGYAGPDDGSGTEPVGLVFISCCVHKKTVVKEFNFNGDRQEIREQAVTEALSLLRLCLLQYFSEVTFNKL